MGDLDCNTLADAKNCHRSRPCALVDDFALGKEVHDGVREAIVFAEKTIHFRREFEDSSPRADCREP